MEGYLLFVDGNLFLGSINITEKNNYYNITTVPIISYNSEVYLIDLEIGKLIQCSPEKNGESIYWLAESENHEFYTAVAGIPPAYKKGDKVSLSKSLANILSYGPEDFSGTDFE